jgi:4a-hydroxytetrahydrobiopterin dehydratase
MATPRAAEQLAALPEAEVQRRLAQLDGWRLEAGEIRRACTFPSFTQAIDFVVRIAAAAEQAGHHPDIDIRYTTVHLSLTTHDESGITDKDFQVAAQINQISQM